MATRMARSAAADVRPPAEGRQADGRQAMDALKLSRQVLRHLPSGIVFFDREGRVDDANPAACAALGFIRPRGLTLAKLFREAELCEGDGALIGPAAALMAEAGFSGKILQRKTLRYTTPEGQGRYLGVTLFPVRTGERGDAGAGLICLLTDLTTIRVLEEELQRRKSLSALGEMAAGIAHEFKNALATISGYGQMLRARLEGEAREQSGKILEQAAMLNNIATEFLTFARPLEIQREPLDLGELLRECAAAIRVQDFPQVRIELEGPFPPVSGDAVWLTSAVINLLRNACEAIVQSGEGGLVQVRFGGYAGPAVRILFVDDGPGVPPETAEKIFIPFFTTKSSGTGLGLAMVHKIITAHQGSVLLTDAAAGHTTFAVLLPTVAEERNRD